MDRETKHLYRITHVERPGETKVSIGDCFVTGHHVPEYCEPYRVWTFPDVQSLSTWNIVGKHVGEFEDQRHILAEETAHER